MRRVVVVVVLLLLASCSGVSVAPPEAPMATIHIMPEFVFWGSSGHYRVVSCDPVVVQVDEASNMSLWAIYDAAMWDKCGVLWYGQP